jgi:hypothetical protein
MRRLVLSRRCTNREEVPDAGYEQLPAFSGQPRTAASKLGSPEKVEEQERTGRERRASASSLGQALTSATKFLTWL